MVLSTKKMGRPTQSKKDNLLQVRLDNETLEKLDACTKNENTTRSAIVRKGINLVYDYQKK